MNKDGLTTVFWLTVFYFFIELAGGLHYNSLALVTDASFMAVNVIGQIMVNYVKRLSRLLPNKHLSFGYERAKVLSGLFNGTALGFMLFYVLVDAYHRIINPQPIESIPVLIVALLGLAVNVFNLIMLYTQSKDINIKGAFLLILNDTLGSVGVIVSALIIHWTGLYAADGITSILIGLLIVYPTYHMLRGSINILMEGIPKGIDLDEVERFLLGNFPRIVHVKDVHVWAIVPEKILLAAKVRTKGDIYRRDDIKELKQKVQSRFGFYDVYIEVYEDHEPGMISGDVMRMS